jgi:pimeloyl-ACP methyl ester carboxylesterase
MERLYNVTRWNVFPRGGHFAPVEEPAAVAGDLAAFVGELGTAAS